MNANTKSLQRQMTKDKKAMRQKAVPPVHTETMPAVQRSEEKISGRADEFEHMRKELDSLHTEHAALQARCATLAAVRDRFIDYAGKSIPMYISHDLRPLVNPQSGATKERVLICSIPKAGTYLYSRLLELLDIQPTGLHLSTTHFEDFRFADLDQFRYEFRELRVPLPIAESIKLIQPGQFAASHLERSWHTDHLADDLRIIMLYREMRDVAVSSMRYFAKSAWGTSQTDKWRHMPDNSEKMLRYLDDIGTFFFDSRCHPVAAWHGRAGVLSLSFEQINGDDGREKQIETITQICEFCRIENPAINPQTIAQELIGASTFTWSGSRSKWQDCWSDDVEKRFVELGGMELNRRFGYSH